MNAVHSLHGSLKLAFLKSELILKVHARRLKPTHFRYQKRIYLIRVWEQRLFVSTNFTILSAEIKSESYFLRPIVIK